MFCGLCFLFAKFFLAAIGFLETENSFNTVLLYINMCNVFKLTCNHYIFNILAYYMYITYTVYEAYVPCIESLERQCQTAFHHFVFGHVLLKQTTTPPIYICICICTYTYMPIIYL